jgi:diphthamide synthase (EF-2-diphthine--ammonia ligase)
VLEREPFERHDVGPDMSRRLVLSWSSGKDSALALVALLEAERPPRALLTTFTEGYERVSMHGVRRALVEAQATAIGLPLVEVTIPPGCSNELYEGHCCFG